MIFEGLVLGLLLGLLLRPVLDSYLLWRHIKELDRAYAAEHAIKVEIARTSFGEPETTQNGHRPQWVDVGSDEMRRSNG